MGNYLYGASVQGIQEFIFKTNQLQEIVGASEIVKSIDTMIDAHEPHEILMQAAGNIKAIFDDKNKLEKVVKEFPKKIMQKAYGITISQAVVKMAGDKETPKELNELEKKLKIQRNKPSIPLDLTINIMELAPKTARPLVKIEKKGDDEICQQSKNTKRIQITKVSFRIYQTAKKNLQLSMPMAMDWGRLSQNLEISLVTFHPN